MAWVVYHEDYSMNWGEHVFPVEKFRLLYERVLKEKLADADHILRPEPAKEDELLLAHTQGYLKRLEQMSKNPELGYYEFEIPCTKEIVGRFILAAGGSILAGRMAVKDRAAANLSGGFHHAFADHGEGFCIVNDIAVCIKVLQKEGLIKKAAVIDCDLHQGNGTAGIFRNDPDVFTFSIHQEYLYPIPKQASSLDIGLDEFTGDDVYLEKLRRAAPEILNSHKPNLVVYQAGADPFEKDQLGLLRLTKKGLQERDRLVISECKKRDIPVVVTMGGGYPPDINDVVDIHFNTLKVLKEIYA